MSRLIRRHLARVAIAAILTLTSWGCPTALTPPFQVATVPTAPSQCPKGPSAAAVWTKQPDYRQVLISAHNRKNLPPPKLTLANLRLYQDGKQLQIVFLQPQPITVGILVDNSGSMEPKLPQTRDALSDFIHDLNPGDEIFVDAFSDRPYTLAPLTTDRKIVIDRLAGCGKTSITH
jgi:von Willebrand factor type A domain